MKDLHMLNWNPSPYCDVGGSMRPWLMKQLNSDSFESETTELKLGDKTYYTKNIYFIKHLWSCSWDEKTVPDNVKDSKKLIEFFKNDPRNINNKFFCEIYDKIFLHYRAGGNWRGEGLGVHKKLISSLKNIVLE
jgi:hypothetical protein